MQTNSQVPGTDIGWVGHNEVKGPQESRGVLPGIGLNAADPAGELHSSGVFLGHHQGLPGDIRQGDPGILHLPGNGQADATGAGAQVQNPWVLLQKQGLLQRQLSDGAGIVPGNEHIPVHIQGHAPYYILL